MSDIGERPVRAAIWARVSTEEQDTQNQVRQLEAFAEGRGWDITHRWELQESAWKAPAEHRFRQALAEARTGKFDVLLVWALDRITRRGPLDTLQIVESFAQYGVRVVSYTESWTEAQGEAYTLLLSIMGWVAQQESNRRSDRTKAGLARARAQGAQIGRPVRTAFVDLEFVHQARQQGKSWSWIQQNHPRTAPGVNGHRRRPTTSTIRKAHKMACEKGLLEIPQKSLAEDLAAEVV